MGECEATIFECLARIEALDGRIGAWEHVDAAGALKRARELDTAVVKGVLHGMPIGVKDIIDVAGMPTRCGTPIYANNMAKIDADCVARAKAAGAIVIGKTVTTELATFNPSRTRNPENPDYTPGGSSAGSAAAVAAGMVPLAIGTQTAGSVIRPAAYCGVVGYKPSFGVVERDGVKMQSETLDTVGVLARTIEDAMKWYAAMSGKPATVRATVSRKHLRPLRIAIIVNFMDYADAEMKGAIADAASALSAAGLLLQECRLPARYDDAQIDQRIIQLVENARNYAIEHQRYRDQLSPKLAEMLDEGAAITEAQYQAAIARTIATRNQTDAMFTEVDAWLMPSAQGAAPKGLESTGDPVFNRLVTALHLPAINIPVFRNNAHMPLGLQLIGARQQDENLFATAIQAIEILRKNQHG